MGDVIDNEGTGRLLQQLQTLWVQPELARRGATRPPRAVQVIFRGDGSPIVHLDEEVVGLRTTLPTDREVAVGGIMSLLDVEFKRVELPAPHRDCAHITVVYASFGAWIDYRFIYNTDLARQHIEAAKEFFAAAKAAGGLDHVRAELDNLYSAAELAAKALLLRSPAPSVRESRNHRAIKSAINREAKLGNIPASWSRAFNDVMEVRPGARYLDAPVQLDGSRRAELRESIAELIAFAEWWHAR